MGVVVSADKYRSVFAGQIGAGIHFDALAHIFYIVPINQGSLNPHGSDTDFSESFPLGGKNDLVFFQRSALVLYGSLVDVGGFFVKRRRLLEKH